MNKQTLHLKGTNLPHIQQLANSFTIKRKNNIVAQRAKPSLSWPCNQM